MRPRKHGDLGGIVRYPVLGDVTPIVDTPIDPRTPVDHGSMRAVVSDLIQMIRAEDAAREIEKEQQSREDRRWLLTRVVIPVITLFFGSGGVVAAMLVAQPEPPSKVDVKEAVAMPVEEQTKRIDRLETQVQKLGEAVVTQQINLSESLAYISEQIEAVSPRARDVEPPPVVKAARDRAADLKRQRKTQELLGEDKK